jgi:hypothetical protein
MPARLHAPSDSVRPWRAVTAPCTPGHGQRALYQCAVTCNSYVIAGGENAIYVIGAMGAVHALEAMFRRIAGPSDACSHGCVSIVATSSCCRLGLGLLYS